MNYHNVLSPIQHMRRPEVHPGGLCWIFFAKHEDIMVWPSIDPLTGLTDSAFQLLPGSTWYRCEATYKGRIFSEASKRSSAGPYMEMQVTGYFGGNDSKHTLSSFASRYHQYVVMFKDLDGQVRFIGSEDNGAELDINYSSGDKDASRRRNLSFTWEHPNPAQILSGNLTDLITDPVTPPISSEGGDFSDDFNTDFNI